MDEQDFDGDAGSSVIPLFKIKYSSPTGLLIYLLHKCWVMKMSLWQTHYIKQMKPGSFQASSSWKTISLDIIKKVRTLIVPLLKCLQSLIFLFTLPFIIPSQELAIKFISLPTLSVSFWSMLIPSYQISLCFLWNKCHVGYYLVGIYTLGTGGLIFKDNEYSQLALVWLWELYGWKSGHEFINCPGWDFKCHWISLQSLSS